MAVLCAAGCTGQEEPVPVKAFELSSLQIDLASSGAIQVPYSGKAFAVNVKASQGVSWDISVKQGSGFITVSAGGEKQGDGVIDIVIAKNETDAARPGSVEITNSLDDRKVTIDFQQVAMGVPAITILPQKTFTGINGDGAEIVITITTEPEVPLTFFTESDWIKKSPSKGNTWIIQQNATTAERTGTVSIRYERTKELDVLTFAQNLGSPLRFAVFSDLHFTAREADRKIRENIDQILLETPAVKAIFLPGDLTDSSTEAQYDALMTVMNDKVPANLPVYYMMGNHDRYVSNSEELFLTKTKSPSVHQYIIIDGYPFITISHKTSTSKGSGSYDAAGKAFLKEKLEIASVDFPNKPIFVFFHAPVTNTMWGTNPEDANASWNNYWGVTDLASTLNPYPQVIAFSGHTHYTLRDERSIHQKNFTSVNDGGSSYGVQTVGLDEGPHPEGSPIVREYLVVEVKPNMDVHIKKVDATNNVEIKTPWIVEAPHDGSRFNYTDDRDKGDDPAFTPGSEISISSLTAASFTMTFPQATDDDVVFSYRIDIKNSKNEVVQQYNHFSRYWIGPQMPFTLSRSIIGLEPGETYTVEIRAEDSFGNRSLPLTKSVAITEYTPDPGSTAPKADWIDVMMTKDGAVNVASSNLPVTTGSGTKPVTSYDNTLKMWTSHYDNAGTGTGSYSTSYFNVKYSANTEFKTALTTAFTMEVYCKSLDNGDRSPFSGQQAGGMGFRKGGTSGVVPEGQQAAHLHVGGGYKFVGYPVTNTTSFYHFLFTFDGAQIATYMNGALMAVGDYSGAVTLPAAVSQEFIIGGDTNAGTNCQLPFYGDIAFARIHGKAVTTDEAYRLYEQVRKRREIGKFDDLNTALTTTIAAMPNGATKNQLLAQGWALMNNIATTEAEITSFLDSLSTNGDLGKPGSLDDNKINDGNPV